MFGWFRRRRRRQLLDEPFPPHWEIILRRNVGHYPRLSSAEQARLRDTLRILIAEKEWEGVGGLFITEEIKITVAAQMALLLLGDDREYFDRVPSVVIYPGAFRTPNPEDDWEDDELSDTILDGQAVYRGPVILAWSEVIAESRDPSAGHNVVLHEFAHQLDFLDDAINGTPPLGDAALEAKWRTVMQAAFDEHRAAIDRGEETFFTEHAAENETEFFADATEAFYCQPGATREECPGVYELLLGYYKVDPAQWFKE